MSSMNFGEVLQALRDRKRVARQGWNGKGMWIVLVVAEDWAVPSRIIDRGVSPSRAFLSQPVGDGLSLLCDVDHRLPWIGMRTADGGFVPWLASQTDLLAEDWEILDGGR